MSLKNLFLIFRKNEYDKELKKKLSSLEINLMEIKSTLQSFQEQIPTEKIIKTKDPPIIIEKINIEKIIVDKYELNNNFGQLGIKELTGKLNIGATYGSEYTPNLDEEEKGENNRNEKKQEPFSEKGPRVNIKAKKD
ncbi:hypothetical protein [Neobacillus vireti]|uniref:Uncharacterized protein n=1 Tax=Neobacillus vireti LMG 21834 TaxID=1131730 RepID=A0AB94ILM7_9BACI|nr:hypothetical protein [Neobacillus vireti]ETI67932.1 hypothetical protein BAVI_15626 [Neobacillus vireti LMG 21834]KLT17351.1 hypothetical protein AA980_15895 [Neobacillus vireti]